MRNRLLLFTFAILFAFRLFAQVTIGTDEPPENGALLEMKEKQAENPAENDPTSLENSEKGMLCPKVSLKAWNKLTPLYGGMDNGSGIWSDESTEKEKLTATGMLVYNINPHAENIAVGFCYWNGKEWISFQKVQSTGAFTIDCLSVKVNGQYTVNVPLGHTNTITMSVNVSKVGSYQIEAYPPAGRGYYFIASGNFMTTGTYQVTLVGMGTPADPATPGGSPGDKISIYKYGIDKGVQTDCTNDIYVSIDESKPDFEVFCAGIVAETHLIAGKPSSITDDKITLRIEAASASEGAMYSLETNTVNGIKFSKRGTLTAGTQFVTLTADGGTPLTNGDFEYTINSNSSNPDPGCKIEIPVATRRMIVALFSNTKGGTDWNISLNNRSVKMMLTNPNLFGTSSSATYNVGGVEFLVGQDVEPLNSKRANTQMKEWMLSNTNPPDIIIISHEFVPDEDCVNRLIDYVKKGGVVIYCTDHNGGITNAKRKPNAERMINGVFGSNISLTSHGDYEKNMKLETGNQVVVGRYEDLTDKYMGRDGGYNCGVPTGSLPSEAQVIAYQDGNKSVRAFMHSTLGFFFFGDGGVFSGGIDDTTKGEKEYNPNQVDNLGNPIPKTIGIYGESPSTGAYNAHLFANIMMWAMDYAQSKRPNGGPIK